MTTGLISAGAPLNSWVIVTSEWFLYSTGVWRRNPTEYLQSVETALATTSSSGFSLMNFCGSREASMFRENCEQVNGEV